MLIDVGHTSSQVLSEVSVNSICGEESGVNDLAMDWFVHTEETNPLQDTSSCYFNIGFRLISANQTYPSLPSSVVSDDTIGFV